MKKARHGARATSEGRGFARGQGLRVDSDLYLRRWSQVSIRRRWLGSVEVEVKGARQWSRSTLVEDALWVHRGL